MADNVITPRQELEQRRITPPELWHVAERNLRTAKVGDRIKVLEQYHKDAPSGGRGVLQRASRVWEDTDVENDSPFDRDGDAWVQFPGSTSRYVVYPYQFRILNAKE